MNTRNIKILHNIKQVYNLDLAWWPKWFCWFPVVLWVSHHLKYFIPSLHNVTTSFIYLDWEYCWEQTPVFVLQSWQTLSAKYVVHTLLMFHHHLEYFRHKFWIPHWGIMAVIILLSHIFEWRSALFSSCGTSAPWLNLLSAKTSTQRAFESWLLTSHVP